MLPAVLICFPQFSDVAPIGLPGPHLAAAACLGLVRILRAPVWHQIVAWRSAVYISAAKESGAISVHGILFTHVCFVTTSGIRLLQTSTISFARY